MNNRRKLVVAIGAGALAASIELFAQQPAKVWRVGFLAQPVRPDNLDSSFYNGFVLGMRDLG